MVYGYCRVSTQMQARDGNSLEAQKKLLIGNGAENVAYEGQAAQDKCDGFEHSKSPLNLEYSYFI